MLVDAKKMKHFRLTRNWTQQHLADVCGVSMRTVQRVEKDGVASNETVAAYASVFEVQASEFLLSINQFGSEYASDKSGGMLSKIGGLLFLGGFVAGVGAGITMALWLI